MLGRRSCMPRTTSSRSLLIPSEDADGDTTTSCYHAEVAEKISGSTLCSPCKIVIGFEVEAEKKTPVDVCESPRSVLEASAVLSSQEKQQIVARSPRSVLGSLLAAKSGSEENVGTGHGIVAKNSEHLNQNQSIITSPSKAIVKASHHDPMDDDICTYQGQGLHVNLQADMALLDADISPLRAAGSCLCLTEETEDALNNVTTPKPWSNFIGSSLRDGEVVADSSRVLNPSKNLGKPSTAPHVNVYDKHSTKKWKDSPGHSLPMSSEHLCKGEGCFNPCHEQFWHHAGLDVEEDHSQSIFTASSPPPCSRSLARASSGFLKMCNFCGRSLRLGKDIFMYRGDQPFCSAECRHQKIALDESKDKSRG